MALLSLIENIEFGQKSVWICQPSYKRAKFGKNSKRTMISLFQKDRIETKFENDLNIIN